MATTPKHMDRRVQRTQQILKQAFIEVVNEKGFPAISIQDITDRANVNRGTFYAHFTDKYTLLEAVICEEMKRILLDALPPVSQWDRSTLHLLIQTVLDCCDGRYCYLHLSKNMMPQFERAAHEGVVELLLEWLKLNVGIRSQVPLETIADIMSWAIVGAAVQRSQTAETTPSNEMASAVLLVIMKGVEQLAMTGIASD